MRNRFIILTMLLPAYLLLVLHAVIPHHHHYAAEEGPLHFHHGSNASHHDHQPAEDHNDPDNHGSTAHFVHSPEFGKAMVKPAQKWVELQPIKVSLDFLYPIEEIGRCLPEHEMAAFHPESPPFYNSPLFTTPSLRGPPQFI